MKRLSGFTVIELLVVIAVIGILAAITTVGVSQYQATTRDSQRLSKATVIAEALEKYYEQHGEYPGCSDLTGDPATVTGTGGVLETVNVAALTTPQAADGIDNSIECSDLTSITDDDIFAYVGDGSGTCSSGSSCLEFTLKYKDEQSGQIETITSRHTTDIATSGDTVLTGSSISSSQIDLSWDAIPNASSYELVRATNAGFTTGVDTSSQPTNSASITTGLSPGTQYWFHVRAISAGGNSNWSNDFTTYTRPAAPTGVVATTASSSQVNVSWNAVAGATSYRVQRSTTSNFAGGTTGSASGIAGSPYSYGSLQQGTQYWFRVYATNSGGEGSASNIDDAITTLPAPTGLATTPTANSINFSWGAVTNASSYDVQYSLNSGFSPLAGSFNDLTGTSQNITGLSAGVTYYVRVYAENATTTSAAASTSATTTVPAPATMVATTNSTTQITADWADVSVATTYKLEYDDNSDFSSITGTFTGLTSSNYAVTGLTQGKTYYFRAYALVGAVSSVASPSGSATTTIANPTGVSVSANDTGSVRAYSAGDWIAWINSPASGNWYYAWGTGSGTCASGTTRQFQFGANYTSPTTFYGYTGWETTATKYMVSPNSGYGIRFHVNARCVGSNATSGTVNSVSGYVY